VEKVEDVVAVGQKVIVKVKEIDERNRVNLTMKGVSDEEKALCEQQNP
jgi:polyribonucleotide nucleotidyltransferase